MKLFQNILVVVNSTADVHTELEQAKRLARFTHAKLHLIDVVKDVSFTVRYLSKDYEHIHQLLVNEKQEHLGKLIESCREEGIEATGAIVEGATSTVTYQAAKTYQADLIIRPAKGFRSVERGNLGASSQRLIRNLPCPAWMTHGDSSKECKLIVAAVDATPDDQAHGELNRYIIRTAKALSEFCNCQLIITYAWSLYGAEMLSHRLPKHEYESLVEHNRHEHESSFARLLAEFGLELNSPNARMLIGEPTFAIPEFCKKENASLLVCGTIARHGLTGLLLGNTSERIMNHVHCSFLALPPEAREDKEPTANH